MKDFYSENKRLYKGVDYENTINSSFEFNDSEYSYFDSGQKNLNGDEICLAESQIVEMNRFTICQDNENVSEIYDNLPSFFDADNSSNKNRALTDVEKNLIEELENMPVFDEGNFFDEDYDIPKFLDDNNQKVCSSTSVALPSVIKEKSRDIEKRLPVSTTSGLVPAFVNVNSYSKGPYFYFNNELIHYDYEAGKTEPIGNFWIDLKKEIICVTEIVNEQNLVSDRVEESIWDLEINCNGRIFNVETTIDSLLNDRELRKISHDRCFIFGDKNSKKEFKKYLYYLISDQSYSVQYQYSSTGWTRINERWIYLIDSGVVGYPDLPISVNVRNHFLYDNLKVGCYDVFRDFFNMKYLSKVKNSNTVFLMHYTCLSVLTTLYQESGHGVNFVVALIGATNSQKTSTAMIFAKLFDRTTKAIPDIRFNSTEAAIAEKMETYGDAILIVDDFLPYDDKRMMSEQMSKSELLIRSYGDRVPRKRSKAYAKINGVSEYSRVKGCCLLTGEIFNTNSESSATRVIQLNFSQGDIDLDRLTYYQRNLMNLPTFIYDFICFVQANIDMVFETIENEICFARNNSALPFKIARFRDTVGIMAAETLIFYRYALERGFMSEEEADRERVIDMNLIIDVIKENEIGSSVKSPAMRICQALNRLLVNNEIQIIHITECEGVIDFRNIIIDYDNFYCILPDSLLEIYTSYCKEFRLDIIYKSSREISSPLKKENALLLKSDEKGQIRSTHKLKAKTNRRFFYIKKDVFWKLCGNFELF